MAFDVSTLADYTDEISNELILKSIFGAETAAFLTPNVGVHSARTINRLETDAVIQDGNGCGFNASGTTDITQRVITVGEMKVQEALCIDDLQSKFTQIYLSGTDRGQDPSEVTSKFLEQKAMQVAKVVETLLWQADSTGSDYFDGLLKIIDDSGSAIDGNTGGTGVPDESNILAILQGMYKSIPADIISKEADDLYIFLGYDIYKCLVTALQNENLFHFDPSVASNYEYILPGTTIKIKALHGLNGTNRIISARTSNLYLGTDLENEWEQFKFRFSEDEEEWRYTNRFKLGTQVAFPGQIVEYTAI